MLDALLDAQDQRMPVPNTGSLYGDLLALTTERAAYLSSSHGRALVRSMVMSSGDAVLTEMRDDFLQARSHSLKPLFDRAIDRGEWLVETDARLMLEMLFGPMYFRVLISREPILGEFLEHLVARVAVAFSFSAKK